MKKRARPSRRSRATAHGRGKPTHTCQLCSTGVCKSLHVAQWEVVFEHGASLGMFLHFKTQETENEVLLDGGDTGPHRKLYYRELIARFAHHPALNWNLGEEINNASTSQKKAWAQYFYDHDPYHHLIVIHNGANHFAASTFSTFSTTC